MEIPKRIIEKYQGTTRNEFIFPVPTNVTCNNHVKKLIEEAEIITEQKVTFYTARHTFGTMFLTEGVPLESLSKMMGHKNISTTQIYAKITSQKISKDMDLVTPKFKTMEDAFLIKMEREEIALLNTHKGLPFAASGDINNLKDVFPSVGCRDWNMGSSGTSFLLMTTLNNSASTASLFLSVSLFISCDTTSTESVLNVSFFKAEPVICTFPVSITKMYSTSFLHSVCSLPCGRIITFWIVYRSSSGDKPDTEL
jgi:hypothetical protein